MSLARLKFRPSCNMSVSFPPVMLNRMVFYRPKGEIPPLRNRHVMMHQKCGGKLMHSRSGPWTDRSTLVDAVAAPDSMDKQKYPCFFREENWGYPDCPDLSWQNYSSSAINKQTPWSESASELYRPSDRRFSAKWLPTFADKGCHVVSVTNPYGRCTHEAECTPFQTHYLFSFFFSPPPRKSGSAGNRTRASESVAKNWPLDHRGGL
jgi:hypothetical protein